MSTPTSRFINLPQELRNAIYCFLLPHRQTITVEIVRRPRGHASYQVCHIWGDVPLSVLIKLLTVSNQTSHEVAKVFYGESTFEFHLCHNFLPPKLPGPTYYRRPFEVTVWKAQYLKHCSVIMHECFSKPQTYKMVQACLDQLTRTFAAAEGHEPKKLSIDLQHGTFGQHSTVRTERFLERRRPYFVQRLIYRTQTFHPLVNPAVDFKYQYILESLMNLHSIESINITGHVTDDFAKRLASVVEGDGTNKPKRMVYVFRRKKLGIIKRWKWPGTDAIRKITDPVFNWDEYVIPDKRAPAKRSSLSGQEESVSMADEGAEQGEGA